MNEVSRSNRIKNVLSLEMAREQARQPRGSPNGPVSKPSNQRPLERLEAENAQLRERVGGSHAPNSSIARWWQLDLTGHLACDGLWAFPAASIVTR